MERKKYYEVRAYLEPVKDKDIIDTLQRIAEKNHMSISQVCKLILSDKAAGLERALSSTRMSVKKPKRAAAR